MGRLEDNASPSRPGLADVRRNTTSPRKQAPGHLVRLPAAAMDKLSRFGDDAGFHGLHADAKLPRGLIRINSYG